MPFTIDDFKKLDSRLKTITNQKVEEFEISLDTPPTLEELPDSNKAYSLYASILFIDIRKSTQLVEESQARSMVKVYRAFMRMAVSCVRTNGGVTRQFLGDRIMGVFLDSKDDNGNLIESSMDKAVKSARAMQTCIDFALNKHLKNNVGGKTISCGIGIDYGKVLLTKVGMYGVEKDDSKENETDCVWVGNCTNRASKYSDLADGGEIFISEKVFDKLSSCLKPEKIWVSAAKQKGNMLFRGYISQKFYLDLGYDLGEPVVSESAIYDEAFNMTEILQQLDVSWQHISKKEHDLTIYEHELEKQKAKLHIQYEKNEKETSQIELSRKKLLSAQHEFYDILCEALSRSFCNNTKMATMGYEFWSKLIDEVFLLGKLIGKNDEDIISQNACYLIAIYDFFKEYDKAYGAMIIMARHNLHWICIRRDTLLWAKEYAVVWKLRSEIERNIKGPSITCNLENYQKALNEIKQIVGY